MSENDSNVFNFIAAVYKVQTLSDNGIRVTLDLPETAIPEMAMLAECKRQGIVLDIKVREADKQVKTTDDMETRPKRKSGWSSP